MLSKICTLVPRNKGYIKWFYIVQSMHQQSIQKVERRFVTWHTSRKKVCLIIRNSDNVSMRSIDIYSCRHPNHQDSSFKFDIQHWIRTKSFNFHFNFLKFQLQEQTTVYNSVSHMMTTWLLLPLKPAISLVEYTYMYNLYKLVIYKSIYSI